MNPTRVYDLSFVSKKVSVSGMTELVISIEPEYFARFIGSFKEPMFDEDYVRDYLGHDEGFVFCEGGRYGYRGCCAFIQAHEPHDTYDIHFELCNRWSRDLVVTLSATLDILNYLIERSLEGNEPEKKQYLEVHTNFAGGLHGHSVWGLVFRVFGTWLEAQGRAIGTTEWGRNIREEFVPSARGAMTEAWGAVAPGFLKKYRGETGVGIADDGRFCFQCFGNACDLAIYPQEIAGSSMSREVWVEFSSHNLDTATQQLTLVAGLAELVRLARSQGDVS